MIVYVMFLLTAIPQLLTTTAVHFTQVRHTASIELLISSALIIFLIIVFAMLANLAKILNLKSNI